MSLAEWFNISEDSELLIDWERALEEAESFDAGAVDVDAAVGKILILVQREAFESGYRKAIEETGRKRPDPLITFTAGHA